MEWVRCPKCRGEVGIPQDAPDIVKCPKCGEVVLSRDPNTKAVWKPEAPAPAWMNPFGKLLSAVGVISCLASAGMEYSHQPTYLQKNYLAVGFSGLLNPLFFIGFPIGMYWLWRSGAFKEVGQNNGPPTAK